MKSAVIFSVALSIAASAFAEEPSLEEKARRVRELTRDYAASVVVVRTFVKPESDGRYPDVSVDYRCPACGGREHFSSFSSSVEERLPFIAAGFALAPDRILVQDVGLRERWVERIEVASGGEVASARPVARYPEENALLLALDRPLPGVKPLVFGGCATNKPAHFYFVEDADGRRVSGLRDAVKTFRHEAASGVDVVPCIPNTLVVDASNALVTVDMRLDRILSSQAYLPPSAWKSEPPELQEKREDELEAKLKESFVPVYLHIDEEKKDRRSSYMFRFSDGDERLTGDIDVLGLALPGGELLVPLNLNSTKVAGLDKMEATLPDGSKRQLEFVGAFPGYGAFLLRFADGKVPQGVRPAAFCEKPASALYRQSAYRVQPVNRNGTVRLTAARRRIGGFTRVHGGMVAPSAASREDGSFLVLPDGSIAAMALRLRASGESWRGKVALPGDAAAKMLAERAFDAEFAVRKGKDRIRVAWIGVDAQPMTTELAREKKATDFLRVAGGRGALVGTVYPGTPAAKAGIQEGDVLLWARKAGGERRERLEASESRGLDISALLERAPVSMFDRLGVTPWPQIEGGVNEVFTRFGIGAKVDLAWVHDGALKEASLVLEQAPVHYRTAKRVRNRALGLVAADLTFEVRAYLKLADDAPGVVISKMQDGSPAAVAGLKPMEVITEVNGAPVKNVVDFAARIKGVEELVFSVRRLDATRVVRIRLQGGKEGGQDKGSKKE